MKINFVVAPQLYTQWCWAAVSSSVSKYFDSASQWTQCQVASAELSLQCCSDGGPCNTWWYLDRALARTQNANGWFAGASDVQQTAGELGSGRPICIRVEWPDGGGHFLAVIGTYQDSAGTERLLLSDPIFGSSSYSRDDLVNGAYQNGHGRWTHTYLTRP
ncbi:papain-like cysteine protease family protein [Rugamonas apoptosis]|uniref:Papain like cysteine protease AvrRpt2 n=1 Tax=Rugamonas apoptosis TaxID=2758570 RepID=A0A7W2F7S7_9BURK|nr:papain-like cysteine protease family protein [Rugamonas apoptosis]MBA5686695.1 hypothetical protein [Rugamonas apoptosis]